MASKATSQTPGLTRSSGLHIVLILLIVEKIIQHIAVTLAFYFNWADIASTVVVSPTILMILGVPIVILFSLSLWGMVRKKLWAVNLVIGLALFDIIGEFVAQGTMSILITVSFLVATLLLILALIAGKYIGT
jgi:hypothetical protein